MKYPMTNKSINKQDLNFSKCTDYKIEIVCLLISMRI